MRATSNNLNLVFQLNTFFKCQIATVPESDLVVSLLSKTDKLTPVIHLDKVDSYKL